MPIKPKRIARQNDVCTRRQVMRVKLPSDLSESDLQAAANGTHDSPVEIFVTLPEDEAAGYLEMDLRPDKRYLYWTVPGNESEADGKVRVTSYLSPSFRA